MNRSFTNRNVARRELLRSGCAVRDPSMIELRRAHIGFSRVVLDQHGVTRKKLLSRSFIAWDQIEDYRIEITLSGHGAGPLYLVNGLNSLLMIDDLRRAMRGGSAVQFAIELIGRDDHLLLDERYRGVARAIGHVLEQIGPRIAAGPRAELERTGGATFGQLRLTRQGVRWRDREPLPREQVETLELFDSSPVKLRVMKHGKVLPYAQTETANLPALHALLEIAQELGYPVRGRELFEALGDHALAPDA